MFESLRPPTRGACRTARGDGNVLSFGCFALLSFVVFPSRETSWCPLRSVMMSRGVRIDEMVECM